MQRISSLISCASLNTCDSAQGMNNALSGTWASFCMCVFPFYMYRVAGQAEQDHLGLCLHQPCIATGRHSGASSSKVGLDNVTTIRKPTEARGESFTVSVDFTECCLAAESPFLLTRTRSCCASFVISQCQLSSAVSQQFHNNILQKYALSCVTRHSVTLQIDLVASAAGSSGLRGQAAAGLLGTKEG